MATFIPIERDGDAHFSLKAVLDGVTYTLEFRWNVRAEAWFMHVWDDEEIVPYALGIRVVADSYFPLYRTGRTPKGLFFLNDSVNPWGKGEEPGFDDLGDRHQLYYVPPEEL